jgi:hypothetical protein
LIGKPKKEIFQGKIIDVWHNHEPTDGETVIDVHYDVEPYEVVEVRAIERPDGTVVAERGAPKVLHHGWEHLSIPGIHDIKVGQTIKITVED